MSTADFRAQILGRKTPSYERESAPERAAEPSPAEQAIADNDVESSNGFTEPEPESAEQQVEEVAQEPTAEPEDWSWAEGFKQYREGVHGLATAELLQALSEGKVPEALMDKLELTMVDGDEEWTGTIADLRNGAQMHANYTKKSTALANERKAYESEKNELIEHFRSWKEDAMSGPEETAGARGLAGLERMLGTEVVQRIAYRLAERMQRQEQLEALEAKGEIPKGTAKALLEREQMARDLEDARSFKAQQEKRTADDELNTRAAVTGKRVQTEALGQFKKLGMTQENQQLTPGVWKLFLEEMNAVWPKDRDPNPQEIRTAVMAAKQRTDRLVKEEQAARAAAAARSGAQTAKKPPVVAGGGAAPGAPTKAPAVKNKAMTTAQFKEQYMSGGSAFRR